MAVNVEIIQFALPRGVATTTLDITSSGFGTPKLAIFIVNNNIGTDDTSMTNAKYVFESMGATDGTRQYSNCASNIDAQSKDYGTAYMDAASIAAWYLYTTRHGEWKSNGWITDGVQIEVVQQISTSADQGGNDPLCTCILMSGSDLEIYVGGFNANTNSTPKAITAVGFQADALFAFGNLRSTLNQWNTATSTYSNAWVLNDGNATTLNSSWQGKRDSNSCDRRSSMYDTDIIIGQYYNSTTKTNARIDTFSATGFTVTNLGPQYVGFGMCYIAFKFTGGYGLDAKIIDFQTTGDHVATGMKVTPEFGMIFADAGVPVKNTIYGSGTYLTGTGIVAFDDTNIQAQCEKRNDATGTMDYDTQSASSLKVLNGNSGTAYLSTSWSFDDAGWTFTTTTSPTDAFLGVGVAIGKVRPVTKSLIHLDGDIGAASIADDDVFDATDEDFTFEFTGTAVNLTSTAVLLSNTPDATSRSIQVDLVDDELKLYLSSDSTTWDIANGTVIGTITASRFYCEMERVGTEIIYRLGGVEQGRIYTTAALAAGGAWTIGNYASTLYYDGIIHAWRFMIGKYRYGLDHPVIATPFADSDTYGAGIVYSDKPALMWNDIAQSIFYGLGATTVGVIESTDWGDELLDDGVTPRCRVGLTISSPSRAEYWLDILANYANCVWYPDGSDLRIAPDQASTSEAPSGLDIVYNGIFDTI